MVFRGGEGLRDQIDRRGQARPAEPVTVRLHSACLTGDLFSSLKCDCEDQLHAERTGRARRRRFCFYLDQEGRGWHRQQDPRLRAAQSRGYDTYDADEMLGFGPDQRRFDFAAAMLRQLGIRRVHASSRTSPARSRR